jgi:hypothetical protein
MVMVLFSPFSDEGGKRKEKGERKERKRRSDVEKEGKTNLRWGRDACHLVGSRWNPGFRPGDENESGTDNVFLSLLLPKISRGYCYVRDFKFLIGYY